jgi:hypothetical protein
MRILRTYPRKLWAAAVVLLVLNACEDVSVTAVEVASVAVTPSQGTLLPGDTLRLTGTPRDASGGLLNGRAVTWTSEDGSVATVSSSGLVEAHSVGEATILASFDGGSGMAVIAVRPRPEIVLSASQLSFGGAAGGDPTDPVQLQITSSGEGTLSQLSVEVAYSAGQSTGWLEATLQGSQAPTILRVRARPATLPSGTHHAEIRVKSAGAASSTTSVAVSFDVGAAPAAIQLSAAAIGFVWEEGQAAPSDHLVQIANSGGGELDGIAASVRYTSGQATGWLTAQLDRTVAPAELTLRATPGTLSTGVSDAFVEISSSRASNSPREIRVRLTVGAPPPELELDPASIRWSILEGEVGDPPARAVTVTNRGSGSVGGLSASVSYAQGQPTGWMNVVLAGETAPANLTVGLAAQSLPPGIYRGTVAVASPDAVNSPQRVTVDLQIAPRAAPELSEILADPDAIVADGVSTSKITVLLRDSRGARLTLGGHQVALHTTGGTLGSVMDEGNGSYTATLTAPAVVGTASITGTVGEDPIGGSATVRFIPGPASPRTSTIDATPSSLIADGTGTSTVTIRLLDDQRNALTTGGDAVVLRLAGGGTIGAVTDQGDGTYVATYTAPTQSGTTQIEGEVNGEAMEDTATIVLGTETPSRLMFGVQPSNTPAGATVSPAVTVRIEDGLGNLVTSGSTSVTLAIGTNPSGATLSGTTTRRAVNGIATFDNLSINQAGDGYTLTASSSGLTGATSDPFNITSSGSGNRLVFGVQPSNTQAGAAISPAVTVRLEDELGNLVQSNRQLTLSIANNPSGGSLSGSTTRRAVNGVATFDNLSIDNVGIGYTLGASGPGVSGATSTSFDITASGSSARPGG